MYRHATLSSHDGDALLALWNTAKSENALTTMGQGLGPQVQAQERDRADTTWCRPDPVATRLAAA
jgi:hypothetical protein